MALIITAMPFAFMQAGLFEINEIHDLILELTCGGAHFEKNVSKFGKLGRSFTQYPIT